MSATIEYHVPSLNASIRGVVEEGVASFRGIPYATLDKRWTHSQIKHSLESPFDATIFGPRSPQRTRQALVTGGVDDPVPGDDEFRCLNLNVTVPQESLKTSSALPVMVWIHGGAFNYGANSVSRYQPIKLALLGKANGNPVIIVQIQYRLGPLGFAASNDLLSEQALLKSSTPSTSHNINTTLGNFGLVDQIHALEWVRDHIREFGGDPTNVTAFGVSAGSASIHHHILTRSPLFDRAILMSGCAPALGPLPLHPYELAWQNFMSRSKQFHDLKTAKERLERARSFTCDELLKNYTSAALGPMGDGTLLPQSWPYTEAQKLTRCKEIIIGDTKIEAIILDGLIQSTPQDKFYAFAKASFKDVDGFFHAFGITPHMEPTAYRDAVRCVLSVGLFQYPNILVARSFPGKTYFYHFDEPSPYPGPTLGLPYHGQCALFLYQNESADYPVEAKTTADNMGRIWTAFASGKSTPWEEYRIASRFMGLGPEGKMELKSLESDHFREYRWFEWLEENYESLKQMLQEYSL